MVDAQAQTPKNGTPLVPELLSGPSAAARATSRIKAGRADTLAALESLGDEAPAKTVARPAVVEPEADEPSTPEPADDDSGDDDEPVAKAADAKPDAETSKRLAAVQTAEKRSREKIAAARAEVDAARTALEKERAEVEAARAELAAYKKARDRAKIDPVSALEALGVDDLEYAAKQAYAKAKADPNNREAAARLLREREHADELAVLKKRLDDRDRADQDRSENESIRREADRYMGDVEKGAAAGDVSPLAKHFLAKHPERTTVKLRQIAVELLNETGDRPDVEDVLARYEKTRRAELEELGIDPSTISATTSKKNDQAAEKKTSAKTLGNDLSTPRVPRPRSSERESRAETLRDLELGKLD